MNWYEIAQNLEQTLLPSEYSELAFPATAKAMDDLNLAPHFNRICYQKRLQNPHRLRFLLTLPRT